MDAEGGRNGGRGNAAADSGRQKIFPAQRREDAALCVAQRTYSWGTGDHGAQHGFFFLIEIIFVTFCREARIDRSFQGVSRKT